MEAQAKRRYRALPLIASPLHRDDDCGTAGNCSDQFTVEKSQPRVSIHERDEGTPAFREREEASSIELFFNLFFVANLTSFTNVHPIDDRESMYLLAYDSEPQYLIKP